MVVYTLVIINGVGMGPTITVDSGGERHYNAMRLLVDGEEELNCYHLQLSMGRCWRIYWGHQRGQATNAAYERLYEDILSQADMSGIPESLTGTVAIVYGQSRYYHTVDRLASFSGDNTTEGWMTALRNSLLHIDRTGCMRTVVPLETGLWTGAEESPSSVSTLVLRESYVALADRRYTEEQQWRSSWNTYQEETLRGVSLLDDLVIALEMLVPHRVPVAADPPKAAGGPAQVAGGPTSHLARLAVKASIADKGTCAVSLCAIGEEDVALVPPCGHVCGPMASSLTACPTCRAPATWTEVRVTDL